MRMQCEATTLASTYADAHRCLKDNGVRRLGKQRLCAHHRAMAERVAQP